MPKISNVECDLVATGSPGLMTFQTNRTARELMRKFLIDKKAKEAKKDKAYKFRLTIEYATKKRTLSQNKLYWALVTILSFEAYGSFGHEEETHEELLRLYAPRVDGALTGMQQPKRSRHMDTVEFSQLVERVFMELSSRGVEMEGAESIGSYWSEWQSWRAKQGIDPLSETYRDIEDYKRKVPFCEACMTYLWITDQTGTDIYVGHMAHIVSKGAGGRDDMVNRVGLCGDCHIRMQHQKGWWALIDQFPHIRWRIEKAFEAQGSKLAPPPAERKEME